MATKNYDLNLEWEDKRFTKVFKSIKNPRIVKKLENATSSRLINMIASGIHCMIQVGVRLFKEVLFKKK